MRHPAGHDLRATRWLTAGGAALNILLVVIAFRLVYKDLHRRSQQTTELRGRKRTSSAW